MSGQKRQNTIRNCYRANKNLNKTNPQHISAIGSSGQHGSWPLSIPGVCSNSFWQPVILLTASAAPICCSGFASKLCTSSRNCSNRPLLHRVCCICCVRPAHLPYCSLARTLLNLYPRGKLLKASRLSSPFGIVLHNYVFRDFDLLKTSMPCRSIIPDSVLALCLVNLVRPRVTIKAPLFRSLSIWIVKFPVR